MIALSIIVGFFSYALFCGVSYGLIAKAGGRYDCLTCKSETRTCYKAMHKDLVVVGCALWPFALPFTLGVLIFNFWNKEDK